MNLTRPLLFHAMLRRSEFDDQHEAYRDGIVFVAVVHGIFAVVVGSSRRLAVPVLTESEIGSWSQQKRRATSSFVQSYYWRKPDGIRRGSALVLITSCWHETQW